MVIVGATVRAKNRTFGLTPSLPVGVEETVSEVDGYNSTVFTEEGNCYLNGEYIIVRSN